MTNVPSGWYPNPHNPGEEMYWDGTSWSGAARKLSASRIEEATLVRADATASASRTGVPEPAGSGDVVQETLDPIADEQEFGRAGFPVLADQQTEALAAAPFAAEPFAAAPFAAPQLAAQQLIPHDGQQWHSEYEPREASISNWFATIALILGCCGAVLTIVPFFVGLVGGGILNLCAIGLCVAGVLRGRQLEGTGVVLSLIGGALGALGFVAMTVGAGTTW
jgi:hypothetical protein